MYRQPTSKNKFLGDVTNFRINLAHPQIPKALSEPSRIKSSLLVRPDIPAVLQPHSSPTVVVQRLWSNATDLQAVPGTDATINAADKPRRAALRPLHARLPLPPQFTNTCHSLTFLTLYFLLTLGMDALFKGLLGCNFFFSRDWVTLSVRYSPKSGWIPHPPPFFSVLEMQSYKH